MSTEDLSSVSEEARCSASVGSGAPSEAESHDVMSCNNNNFYNRQDLAGRDFSGCSLSDAIFEKALLRGAKFNSTVLRRATFELADAGQTQFSQADLTEVCLSNAQFQESLFYRTDLAKVCGARGACFQGAKLYRAFLNLGNFREACFRKASITGASCVHTDFRFADLREIDFTRTDLRGADLRGADLRGATLNGANVEGALFFCARLEEAMLLRAENLTACQLQWTEGDDSTTLPPLIKRPRSWSSEGEDRIPDDMPSSGYLEDWPPPQALTGTACSCSRS